MATNINKIIRKLLLALSMRGDKYAIDRQQFWSKKANKMCTCQKLSKVIPAAKWNKLNPDKKPKRKGMFVKVEVMKAYNNVELLQKLAFIYKEV